MARLDSASVTAPSHLPSEAVNIERSERCTLLKIMCTGAQLYTDERESITCFQQVADGV